MSAAATGIIPLLQATEHYLQVMRLSAAYLLDTTAMLDIDFVQHEVPERLAVQLTASLRVPSEVLQDDRVVASYPASLWDHVKQKLGLGHRSVEVVANETLVYPDIEVLPGQTNVRIYHTTDTRVMPS